MIRITDILGQEVLSEEVPLHQGEYFWDASNLPNGIYYGVLTTDEVTETRHIRIQR
ncbi:MAG: T9SS type A sorting domain-containing protein [Chlorobi bacterium]|nr:T9SS type A sorting domain-containing protein [Chlorobiota bacterium]